MNQTSSPKPLTGTCRRCNSSVTLYNGRWVHNSFLESFVCRFAGPFTQDSYALAGPGKGGSK